MADGRFLLESILAEEGRHRAGHARSCKSQNYKKSPNYENYQFSSTSLNTLTLCVA
jgi:hypothetical protein